MGQIYAITTEGEEALTTSVETVLQVRGHSSTKAEIIGWGIGFDGVTAAAEPVRVRLLRQTTDGTASAATEVQRDPDDPAADCTGFHTFTAEPTAGDVLWEGHVHPQGGRVDFEYAPGRGWLLDNAATSRIGIDVLAAAAVNCTAYIRWEE